MKFWLATANLERIETCLSYGIFEGVITNPHVVAQEKTRPKKLFKEICGIAGAAYYQLRAGSVQEMKREAEEMLSIDPRRMRIKVPATRQGFRVIADLTDQGIDVMATIVPTNTWMLFAIAAGAKQIAPYSGMLQKRNIIPKFDGVVQMQQLIDTQELDAEICTGLYHPTEVAAFANEGIKSGFIWEKDVESFLTQDLVGDALAAFDHDWSAIDSY